MDALRCDEPDTYRLLAEVSMTRRTIQIDAPPFGKQRHRVSYAQRRTYNTGGNEAYEALVQREARKVFPVPFSGAVRVEIIADFTVPKRSSKRKAADLLHRPHMQKPDADNVAKAVLDGLNGIAYHDDKAVSDLIVSKRYGLVGRVVVHVTDISADSYAALRAEIMPDAVDCMGEGSALPGHGEGLA